MIFLKKEIKKFLPLSESTYYILLSLYKNNHGYGIMKGVEELTNGEVKIGAGTLYGAISKLLNDKIIIEAGEEGRKKLYALTEFGLELLMAEYERIQRMNSNGKSILEDILK